MEVYNCKVLLGGSRDNEVRKKIVPAAEVILLKHLHGEDNVIDVEHVGTTDLTGGVVRDMLALSYSNDYSDSKVTPPLLRDVFGPPSNPLPGHVEGVKLRTKVKSIPAADVTRWRETRLENLSVAHSDEPSFAD